MESVFILVPHHLHPVAAMREMQRLLGHQGLVTLLDLAQRAQQKLTQLQLHMRFDRLRGGTGANTADQIQPLQGGVLQDSVGWADRWFVVERNKKRRWSTLHAVAEKSRGRYPNHGEWLTVDDKAGPDYGAVFGKFLLPGTKAHHGDARSSLAIVVRCERAAHVRENAKGGKIIAGNVLALEWFGWFVAPVAADPDHALPGLEGGQLGETSGFSAKLLVLLIGEEGPVVLHAAVNAAILFVANPPQVCRVGYWQRLQQHCINQGEDRCGGAYAQRQGENRGRRESWRLGELT